MTFSERQKLEKEYFKWLNKNKGVRGTLFDVLTFLNENGNLVTKEEHQEIRVLEKALELACSDYLLEKYKSKITKYRKPVYTIKNYKYKAEKVLEGENGRNQREGII